MASNAEMRASDADRDRIAAALREHLAAGRLTNEEFGERLDRTFAAKTLGELDGLTADLPVKDLDQLRETSAGQRPHRPVEEQQGSPVPAWRAAWRPWAVITVFAFLIWLVSGAGGGPWFLWIALLAGVVLLARAHRGGPPRGHPHRHHGQQGL